MNSLYHPPLFSPFWTPPSQDDFSSCTISESGETQNQNMLPLNKVRPREEGELFYSGETVAIQVEASEDCRLVEITQIASDGAWCYDPHTQESMFVFLKNMYKIADVSMEIPSAEPTPIVAPTVESLVEEFSSRPFRPTTLPRLDNKQVYAFEAHPQQSVRDKERFLALMHLHNMQFQERTLFVRSHLDCVGALEEKLTPVETKVVVIGDLHSDCASLLELLRTLRRDGYLDANFKCQPHCKVVFLGDYIDRGKNDIEVLSLLMAFHSENPQSVVLLRGNHEDVDMTSEYSEDVQFIHEHYGAFTTFFESLPVGLCLACEEKYTHPAKAAQHQYVHFSHGAFSPAMFGENFLTGADGLIAVEKEMHFPSTLVTPVRKAQESFLQLSAKYKECPAAIGADGYTWHDVGERASFSPRGRGFVLAGEDFHQYSQVTKGFPEAVCAFVRGHEHIFKETTVPRRKENIRGHSKVICTTLATNMGTGFFDGILPKQPIQGMVLTVRPKVGDWLKAPIIMRTEKNSVLPKFQIRRHAVSMFEGISSRPPLIFSQAPLIDLLQK